MKQSKKQIYANIKVPPSVHLELKILAAKSGKSIIDCIDSMIEKEKQRSGASQ